MLESKQRLEVAAKKLEIVQKDLREERARAGREANLRAQNENAGTEKLQKTIVDLTQKHETAVAEARSGPMRRSGRSTPCSASSIARWSRSATNMRARIAKRSCAVSSKPRHARHCIAPRTFRPDTNARQPRQKTLARAADERSKAFEREAEQLRSEMAGLRAGHDARTRASETAEGAHHRTAVGDRTTSRRRRDAASRRRERVPAVRQRGGSGALVLSYRARIRKTRR